MRFALAACSLLLATGLVHARDTELKLPIQDIFNNAEFKEKLGTEVKFYFADQPAPKGAKSLGEFTTNKKTNAINKSDEDACRWVMLSALVQLKDRAIAEGADGVSAVVSYYKKNTFASATEYECHVGDLIAGVALKGTLIKSSK
ncbi:hypothetical protein IGB42_01474 [Andreprevotia sp. IGB-42]|uniref:excinuclease ATPase subunit n=1 Tax=Andreprevotia sp. IGB-42 TaxID=2497473 RepID=UPI0013588072|nr:excinuclease ATPase subunit [Andreprevotia sp. IGB-42]KAF0813795.1 hypothetical protein IGB42_01474 [Andreprevotia sp. IGB-42]